jgi:alpha-glucosidase
MLAGHADYTPLHFGDRRCETSETHQIASAIVLTAPLLVYAEHPDTILRHPAAAVIKKIPSVWDETIVLPGSVIGELSAFAKRNGNRWFLSVMNGEAARFMKIDLSFLSEGDYSMTLIRDKKPTSAMASLIRKRQSFGVQQGVLMETTLVRNNDAVVLDLIPGGGFVAMFEKVMKE